LKILVINQKQHPYKSGIVTGGVEKVSDTQIRILAEHGHTVGFVTSVESDDVGDDIVMLRTNLQGFDSDHNIPIRQFNIRYNEQVSKKISQFDPDIIICHETVKNSSLIKELTKIAGIIPTIYFVHQAAVGGISVLGIIDNLSKFSDAGGFVVNVSETNQKDWITTANRSKKHLKTNSDPSKVFEAFCYVITSYEEYKVKQTGSYALMVARASEDKKIEKGIEFCQKAGIDFKWCHPKAGNEADIEYYNILETKINPDNNFVDLPRNRVLDKIAEAKYVLICGVESASVVAVESNLSGVPVLLLSTIKNHPIPEMCAPGIFVHLNERTFSKNIEILKKFKYPSYDEKLDISKKVKEFYSKENTYSRIMNIIDLASVKRKRLETKIFGYR